MDYKKFYADCAIANIELAVKETKFSDAASIKILQRGIALQLQSLLDAASDPIINYELINKLNALYQSCEIILKTLRG